MIHPLSFLGQPPPKLNKTLQMPQKQPPHDFIASCPCLEGP